MKLYNTKTLEIEEFKPRKEGEVSLYVCGPTVYNYAHIGNARPMVVFDVLKRVFEAIGLKVNYVSNYTDVDDKIIHKALEEGVSEEEIANRYIQAYEDLRKQLNIEQPDHCPRVTHTMDSIISFIKGLQDQGHAYEVNGDVYFSVDSVSEYGSLSHQNLEELDAGNRIAENEQKKNPLDFTLWKKTDKGIQWESPWGKGRPGWHTECVVMINENLGQTIDIHGGGLDLKFPHHENEAAQQRAMFGHELADHWMHNAMVNIDGEKMSKSLGNTLWAMDVTKELGTNLTRWLISSVHYRKELNFSDETIQAAKTELEKILMAVHNATLKVKFADVEWNFSVDTPSFDRCIKQMENALNTPNAYTVIFETVKELNASIRQKEPDYTRIMGLVNSIEKMMDVLGIKLEKVVVSKEDKQIYQAWLAAKKERNFDQADQYRNILQEKGLI